ncbi:MAG: indole-3-glycerol phosphate synthase TrpC, partial [Ignavibacteriales bacterium]|nr:indole-3-glycerol phosphate synthase TrpC [Ignavibacteriales bacterium]
KEQASVTHHIRPFDKALRTSGVSVIAEVKKASPSKGVLVKDFDHLAIAQDYEKAGANALSVLTDAPFFQGEKRFIAEIKEAISLPILRKDFIIDEYQVYESKVIGADAILLIVKALDIPSLRTLYECAQSIELSILVEAHTKQEVEIANSIGATIIGINNRDLNTFEVSVEHSVQLRPLIRSGALAVSESGIKSSGDVSALRKAGFDAILIGEGLVTNNNEINVLQELIRT